MQYEQKPVFIVNISIKKLAVTKCIVSWFLFI